MTEERNTFPYFRYIGKDYFEQLFATDVLIVALHVEYTYSTTIHVTAKITTTLNTLASSNYASICAFSKFYTTCTVCHLSTCIS